MIILLLLSLILYSLSVIPNNLILTSNGPVQGYTDPFSGVQIWRGIPFGKPPINNMRFKSPSIPDAWKETKQTTEQANICPQLHIEGNLELGAEDCLYLDVYIPNTAFEGANLPVMVWLFGGGYVLGDGYEFGMYDATNLAKNDVIIVAPNYRLASIGFLALDELKEEDQYGSTGNYALQDQTLALQWVADNISKFGGNPKNVTIFGESAGAFSVCWHLVSPVSRSLFQGAIMESGSCDASFFFLPYKKASEFSYEFAADLGCTNRSTILSCLRALPVSTLMGEALPGNSSFIPYLFPIMPWGATIDGAKTGLLDVPLNLINSGNFNQVPIIAGTNLNEGSIFVPIMPFILKNLVWPLDQKGLYDVMVYFFNPTLATTVLEVYPVEESSSPDLVAAEILRDYMFTCPTRRFLRAISKTTPAWMYQYTHKTLWVDYDMFGVYHSSELPLVFDNQWPAIIHGYLPADQAVADTFGYFWTNLAIYGNPNGYQILSKNLKSTLSRLPEWPLYTTEADQNIVIDMPVGIQRNLYSDKCDFWDKIVV